MKGINRGGGAMITQQCFAFRDRKRAKREEAKKKGGGICKCKVRRAGDLDPTLSP